MEHELEPPDLGGQEKARLLLVEAEESFAAPLCEQLHSEGFTVVAQKCAAAAWRVLKREHFDILLCDTALFDSSPSAMLQRLGDLGRDTLTIMMTASGTVAGAVEAMQAGAFDYLVKPLPVHEVARVVRRAMEHVYRRRAAAPGTGVLRHYELSEALASTMPLDEQLQLILSMVLHDVQADGVSLVVQDPQNPQVYLQRLGVGVCGVPLRHERIVESFLMGRHVLAHGHNVAHWLKLGALAETKVHAFMSTPLRIRGAPFGMLNAFSIHVGRRFSEGERRGLAIFGGRAANAIEAARMHTNLQMTFTQTIEGFARALEAKDPYTHGHSDRVAIYARLIAQAMGLSNAEVLRIQHGGLMHDIGKIGIRSHDLNKPQKLTPAEYTMFRSHPVQGKRIIEPIHFLKDLVPSVYFHHEAFNGTGYPEGLAGNDIPLEARILAVADSYDAMTSNRPYRKALPHEVAVTEFCHCAGGQFDPQVVGAFLTVVEQVRSACDGAEQSPSAPRALFARVRR